MGRKARQRVKGYPVPQGAAAANAPWPESGHTPGPRSISQLSLKAPGASMWCRVLLEAGRGELVTWTPVGTLQPGGPSCHPPTCLRPLCFALWPRPCLRRLHLLCAFPKWTRSSGSSSNPSCSVTPQEMCLTPRALQSNSTAHLCSPSLRGDTPSLLKPDLLGTLRWPRRAVSALWGLSA